MINNEPWFVGKDVASVLGYANTKDALAKRVEREDKRGSQIATPPWRNTNNDHYQRERSLLSHPFK